jgi:hypothetical protein
MTLFIVFANIYQFQFTKYSFKGVSILYNSNLIVLPRQLESIHFSVSLIRKNNCFIRDMMLQVKNTSKDGIRCVVKSLKSAGGSFDEAGNRCKNSKP